MGLKSFLFGGSSKPSGPGYMHGFGVGGYGGLANLAGADVKWVKDPQTGGLKPKANWSTAWKPINSESANAGYDYSNIDDAIAKYKAGPATLDYTSLPDTYYTDQMSLGSKDINRQGDAQLAKLQEAIGTRRPGLLLKAGQDNARTTSENLASMNTTLRGEQAKEKTALGVQQQKDQADLVKSYLDSFTGASQQKLSTQSGITQEAQQRQQDLMKTALQSYLDSWRTRKSGGSSKGSGLFGTVANLAGKAASAYAGGA